MPRRLGVTIAALVLTSSSAFSERVEVSRSVAYSHSQGVSTSRGPLLGQAYDRLNVNSGGSFNFTVGVFASEQMEFEFLFGRQSSRLDAEGAARTIQVSDLTVNHYMGNFVYNMGTHDTK